LDVNWQVFADDKHFHLQVYLDFGLAIPKLSVHGMVSSLKELLELAPIKKVTVYIVEALKKNEIMKICILRHV
jgi:hypothetical protein